MALYRIMTERKNAAAITDLVARWFGDFLLLDGQGYWKGKPEPSLVIEVETDDVRKVTDAALAIKKHNRQEAVMVQRISNHAWLL